MVKQLKKGGDKVEAHTVTNIIKGVVFVNTPTPDSDHILIPIDHELEPISIPPRGNPIFLFL